MNGLISKLKAEGWMISEVKLSNFLQDKEVQLSFENIRSLLLNTDIKYFGDTWFNFGNKNKYECFGVFQISKIRNVAAPEVDQDSRSNPYLFKCNISDGVSSSTMLDLRTKPVFSNSLEPGCKAFINGSVTYKSGMLLVTDQCSIKILGGKVLDLARAETVAKLKKTRYTGSHGPPKFTPFGNRLNININEIQNFKALSGKIGDSNEEQNQHTEFGDKREAEIKKIKEYSVTSVMTDKSTLLNKFHGGGTSAFVKNTIEQQDQNDANLTAVMRHGFSIGEAKKALKVHNNVNAAVDYLLQNKTKSNLVLTDGDSHGGRGRHKRTRGKGNKSEFLEEDDPWFDPVKYAEKVGLSGRPNNTFSLAELMGAAKSSTSESFVVSTNDYYNPHLIGRGFECLAQVMDGSYRDAIVLDILPNKCLKIKYLATGEVMQTNASLLKMKSGEKILDYMIPNVAEWNATASPEYGSQSLKNIESSYNSHGNSSARSRGRTGGRHGGSRRGGQFRNSGYY